MAARSAVHVGGGYRHFDLGIPRAGRLRDLLDAVGAVLDFPAKTLACQHLDGGLIKLGQMRAGHFLLEMWPTLKPFRWRKFGLDGVAASGYSSILVWVMRRIGESTVVSVNIYSLRTV